MNSILDDCSAAVGLKLSEFQEEIESLLSIPQSRTDLETQIVRVSTLFDDLQHQIEECLMHSPSSPTKQELALVNTLMSANGKLEAFKLKLKLLKKRLLRVRQDGCAILFSYSTRIGATLLIIHRTSQGSNDFFHRFEQTVKIFADEILTFSTKLIKFD